MNNGADESNADAPFAQVSITRWRDGRLEQTDDLVIREARIGLYVNGDPVVHLMCLAAELDALAVGFLISEGILRDVSDLRSVDVDLETGRIVCVADVDERALADRRANWTLGTGCGGGGVGTDPNEPAECRRINTRVRFGARALSDAGEELNRSSQLFRKTGGVHSAAICDSAGTILTRADDVGRHNAFDKAVGMALLRKERVDDKAVLSTGRICAAVASKAIRHKIPLIASRSAPTVRALWLADRYGVSVIGFQRAGRMNVYTCPERVTEC